MNPMMTKKMNPMMKKMITAKNMNKKIYNILMSQEFVDWYEGEFMDHVTGETQCLSREEILEGINNIFELKE